MSEAFIEFPYSAAASKNSLRGKGGTGTSRSGKKSWVYMRPAAKALMQNIHEQLAGSGPWYQNKVWLDIFVTMPSRSSDAINVLELVADGVKTGIGVDDKWFSIRRLDWDINKHDPLVTVLVSQVDEWDGQVCSSCNKLKPATTEHFAKGQNTLGLRHTCKQCSKANYVGKEKTIPCWCGCGELTVSGWARGHNLKNQSKIVALLDKENN